MRVLGNREFTRDQEHNEVAKPRTADRRIKPGRIRNVLTRLGREIAQDHIPVGAALPPEPDLEARFGVGRGVVREAVKTLAAKGMVSVRPRHGTHVLPRSEWSLLDRDVLSWLVGQNEPDRHHPEHGLRRRGRQRRLVQGQSAQPRRRRARDRERRCREGADRDATGA